MRGRFKVKASYWQSMGASAMVMGWGTIGFTAWFSAPVSYTTKRNQPSCFEPPAHSVFISDSVKELFGRGMSGVWDSRTRDSLGVISPLKVVPKKGNKFRLILELSRLNEYMVFPKFKYDSIKQLTEVFDSHDLLFSAYLKDGYWHCDLHVARFTYMCFEWEVLLCCAPFRLCTCVLGIHQVNENYG